ncbi:MAG: T9SS type A sorting domain-containing protein, partial [Rhodothermaceae bacterium]|nr:T9SS type A sorting domain-containing protein [Rhodothermaceae bacterium]
SGSYDNTIRLWDIATGQELLRLVRHIHDVNSVVFSPDGTQLASGSDDHTIRLWDLITGEELRRFDRHVRDVNSVVFSLDGTHLASGSDDGTIRLWDIASGREIDLLDHGYPVYSIAISGNGRFIASAGATAFRLWNATATALETVPLSDLEIPPTFTHYPNPAGAFTTVEYALSKVSQVQISIHDLLGREMVTVLDATQPPGSHSLQLATGHLSGGIYFVRLITDDKQVTRPLIVR